MTPEELNTAIYHKMEAEQDSYRDWLLTLPPDEILQHAYEYLSLIHISEPTRRS